MLAALARVAPALLAVVALAVTVEAQSAPSTSVPESHLRALDWRCIGPFRGGRVTTVTGVRQHPFRFYFGACGGGIWRTDDGGTTWRNVSDGFLRTGTIGALAVAPSDPNVLYAGTGEAQVRGVTTSFGDGVYRSRDAGKTWEHVGLKATRHISAIVVHPRDPDTLWVGAQGLPWIPNPERGVYRSTDGGDSWELVHHVHARAGVSSLALDPQNPRVLYAGYWEHQRLPWKVVSGGAHSGLWKSTDGGDTWTARTDGLPDVIGKIGVAVSPLDGERVWAIVEADDGGLFRSDDAGATWTRVNEDRVLRARAWYYTRVFADTGDVDTVYVLNAPVMRSRDGGKTFARVATPHGDNHALWIHPDEPDWMINGNDGGANVSFTGGASWTRQDRQPTAQFYRVTTDAGFPYRVYGGQQDNSTVSIASRTGGGGIGRADWHAVGGGESAFIAFDPDDPRFVYAGVYQGIISEWDRATRSSRNVMADPYLGLGTNPRDVSFRFNWNAPIITSPHDRNVVYHAGNVVLRTTNRGQSWSAISPDLTRDEEDKQGEGGGPITNEAAGAETYNTIQYLAASPHVAGELWAGTDDGFVWVTRNEGADWANVTPPNLGEAMINSIELSPHDRRTAFLAVTRYKLGDFTPYLLVTEDGGATWEMRVRGIPADAFVRVVREDPARRGLLYAGTEGGVYVSFDNGLAWQSLQLDLPSVPITDLTLRGRDLVAATQGRAFWILDDVSPLRELGAPLTAELGDDGVHLFAPRAAVRFEGGGWKQPPADRGQNPPPGVIVRYLLGPEFDSEERTLALDVLDTDGAVLRSWSSDTADAGDDVVLPTEPGMNRIVWDLRVEHVPSIKGQFLFGNRQGYRVAPGEYRVRLSAGDATVSTARVLVREDPRLSTGPADYASQQRAAAAIHDAVTALHDGVTDVRDARTEIAALLDDDGWPDTVRTAVESWRDASTAWEEGVLQVKQKTFQDVINFPNRLNAELIDLLAKVDGGGAAITDGVAERAERLLDRWRVREGELRELLGTRRTELEAALRAVDRPVIR